MGYEKPKKNCMKTHHSVFIINILKGYGPLPSRFIFFMLITLIKIVNYFFMDKIFLLRSQ